MEATAKAQQVEATEEKTDPNQKTDHRKHAGRAHREDRDPKNQGDEAIG